MKIARFTMDGGAPSVGFVHDDRIFDLAPFVPTIARRLMISAPPEPGSTLSWIQSGWLEGNVVSRLEAIAGEIRVGMASHMVGHVRLLPPIDRPGQVFGVGRNFPAHARESNSESPEIPVVFGKAVSSIIGHGDQVVIPEGVGRVEHEAELAVIIGRTGRSLSADDAEGMIAGYTCFNDVTAREMQKSDYGRGWPWLRSKGIDTFGPMGPWLVTPGEFQQPLSLDITCVVGGQVRQSSNTSSMTFTPEQVIAFISQTITLSPGDVIALGTPAGVSALEDGDTVEVYVQGIGRLVNPVVAGKNQ